MLSHYGQQTEEEEDSETEADDHGVGHSHCYGLEEEEAAKTTKETIMAAEENRWDIIKKEKNECKKKNEIWMNMKKRGFASEKQRDCIYRYCFLCVDVVCFCFLCCL